MLSIRRGRPPEKVAGELGVPADQESVLARENVFWAGEDPVHRVTTWIPWTIAEGTGLLAAEIPHPYGIHGILEDRGHVMTRQRETVTARMPAADEETRLRIRPGVAVLDVWHTSIDQHGIAYELTRFVMRSDLTGLRYDIPVE